MQSMTGFGQATLRRDSLELRVSLRSVNHRFLDLQCRLPESYLPWESRLTRMLRAALRRGRVELRVTRQGLQGESTLSQEVAESWLRRWQLASSWIPGPQPPPTPAWLLAQSGVIGTLSGGSEAWELELLEDATRAALDQLLTERQREGAALQRDLQAQIGQLMELRARLMDWASQSAQRRSDRLQARIEALISDPPDPLRLQQEIALLVQRSDVHEELERLGEHLRAAGEGLSGEGPHGRALDFLAQEILREINTTASKVQDAEAAQLCVSMKSCQERMREQVANLE